METGKQNEIKKKLDELKEIPEGFRFDAESTWQKLETKLTARPARKKISWLYAAAILLFAIGAAIFFLLNRTGKENSIDPVTKTIESADPKKAISPEESKTINA